MTTYAAGLRVSEVVRLRVTEAGEAQGAGKCGALAFPADRCATSGSGFKCQ